MQQIQVISIRNQGKKSAGSYQLMSHKPLTITAMAKDKTLYTCNDCGATTPRWLGKCPSCGAWNSLVESVAGLHAVDTLATAPQVARLAFGHLDFQVDAGMACGADEAELLPVRMALVLASRRAGLAAPVDGVTVDTRDPERMRHDANRARRMGFGAKLCIHPAQVAPLHAAFDPDDAAVAQALRVQQALRDAGGGVCVLYGRMVDAPVLLQAEQTLARHARAQQRDRR